MNWHDALLGILLLLAAGIASAAGEDVWEWTKDRAKDLFG